MANERNAPAPRDEGTGRSEGQGHVTTPAGRSMHGDRVVTAWCCMQQPGFQWFGCFALRMPRTHRSCRQPAGLRRQTRKAAQTLLCIPGTVHRDCTGLVSTFGSVLMHVRDVNSGWGWGGVMGLCLYSTNLRLLREENLGLAARGILRKDRLR